MIKFRCHHCGNHIQVIDSAAGKSGKCAKCGAILQIPSSGQAQSEAQTVAARPIMPPQQPRQSLPIPVQPAPTKIPERSAHVEPPASLSHSSPISAIPLTPRSAAASSNLPESTLHPIASKSPSLQELAAEARAEMIRQMPLTMRPGFRLAMEIAVLVGCLVVIVCALVNHLPLEKWADETITAYGTPEHPDRSRRVLLSKLSDFSGALALWVLLVLFRWLLSREESSATSPRHRRQRNHDSSPLPLMLSLFIMVSSLVLFVALQDFLNSLSAYF